MVLDLILQLLLRDQWHLLGQDGIGAAFTILSRDKERTLNIANERGLSKLERALLDILLDRRHENPDSINLGLISGTYYQNDWTDGLPEQYRDLNVTDGDARGVLRLVGSIVRFAQSRQVSDLTIILDHPNTSMLFGLPLSIQSYLPMPVERGLSTEDKIEHLRRLTQTNFDSLLSDQSNWIMYRVPASFSLGTSCTEETWEKLVNTWPEMALFVWHRGAIERWGDYDLIYTNHGVEILGKALTLNPKALLMFPDVWGKLFSKDPNSNEIRDALLQVAVECEPRQWRISERFTHVRLDLPREAAFLPHLLPAVLPDLQLTIQGNSDGKNRDLIARRIKDLTGDVSILQAIKNDRKQSQAIKAAAALMIQIADTSDASLDGQTLISFYEPGKMTWYLESLTNFLGIFGGERIAEIRFIVGSLLMTAREEYRDRQVINKLLNVWRETSQAPIQKAGVEARWLVGI